MLKIPRADDAILPTEEPFSMPFTPLENAIPLSQSAIVVNPSANLQTDLVDAQTEMLERIARMLLLGFTSTQIAIAASSSASEIEQLVKTQELQACLDRLITLKTEQASNVADGWDEVESDALEVIKLKLQNPFGVDEDFALRAATLANKASRGRAQQQRAHLPGGAAVDNAVIYLGATFVGNLQQNFEVQPKRDLATPEKKVFNSLSAQDVTNMLGGNEVADAKDEIANLFDEGLSLIG